MGRICVVEACRSEYYPDCGLSFHRFPKDPNVREIWINNIPMSSTRKLTDASVVCSKHFKAQDFVACLSRPVLKCDALPSVFLLERLDQVESWMDKFDKDMEKIDLKIQIMRNNYTNACSKRTQLENMFAKHDKEMKEWQFFKDEREKARLFREKMTNAAAVVQSWWRGLLVRLKLGPFKPSRRPPPPPPPKKKK